MFYLNCLGLVVSMSDLDIYVLDYIPSGGCSSQDFRRIKNYFNPGEGIKIPPEIKLRFNLARQKAKNFSMLSRFVWPKHVSLIGWDFHIVPAFDWKDLHCKICTKQTSAELRISRKWFLSNIIQLPFYQIGHSENSTFPPRGTIDINTNTIQSIHKKTYTIHAIQLAFGSLEGLRCSHLKKPPRPAAFFAAHGQCQPPNTERCSTVVAKQLVVSEWYFWSQGEAISKSTWNFTSTQILLLIKEIRLSSWYVVYPIIYEVLYMTGGAEFLPSTVCPCFCLFSCNSKWIIINYYLPLVLDDHYSGSLDHILLKKVWHVVFEKPYYNVQIEHPAWNISEKYV